MPQYLEYEESGDLYCVFRKVPPKVVGEVSHREYLGDLVCRDGQWLPLLGVSTTIDERNLISRKCAELEQSPKRRITLEFYKADGETYKVYRVLDVDGTRQRIGFLVLHEDGTWHFREESGVNPPISPPEHDEIKAKCVELVETEKLKDIQPVFNPEREDEQVRSFATGAVRSTDGDQYRHDLIPACAIRRLSERFAIGAKKYPCDPTAQGITISPWKKGIPGEVVVNHLMEHLLNFMEEGNSKEDNLGAILWNASILCWYEENKPEMLEGLTYARNAKATG